MRQFKRSICLYFMHIFTKDGQYLNDLAVSHSTPLHSFLTRLPGCLTFVSALHVHVSAPSLSFLALSPDFLAPLCSLKQLLLLPQPCPSLKHPAPRHPVISVTHLNTSFINHVDVNTVNITENKNDYKICILGYKNPNCSPGFSQRSKKS